MRLIRMALAAGMGAAAIGAAVWALWPRPLLVDLVRVATGPMVVMVSAEGVTRVRETWTVTAPISGTLTRSPVREGDAVTKDVTEVAQILPAAAPLLDARARAQAEAAVTEAEAAVRQAEVALAQSVSNADHAEAQLARDRALAERGTISARALEDSLQTMRTATAALEAARFDLDLHRATLERVKAQLDGPRIVPGTAEAGDCCIRLRAPQTGTVLTVTDLNARPVQAGEVLMTMADLQDLKVEVDLLSTDAVRVRPGAAARIERWGGPGVLEARVDRVDPAGFTRVSALGIEEQRVRLHLDFVTPPEARAGLGDGYRVFVRVVVWSTDAVRQIPESALFRDAGGWAVFRAVEGRARLTPVTIGQAQDGMVAVESGLADGDLVVAYPGNRIAEGAAIAARD
ncbi:efflux RND transporter periplasmic adaptor subunit [Gemmobacter nectariphilus]|uniref:efflux RND transporter periplasmic adaptor subunit n=1 Tax=Gemmobacter nectariphilus TaxID=220343 RepID=UPI0003F89D92|nr:HlyD family efflux transporter periplasmic adaptor subunit [Gemmobacter nectariphilus]